MKEGKAINKANEKFANENKITIDPDSYTSTDGMKSVSVSYRKGGKTKNVIKKGDSLITKTKNKLKVRKASYENPFGDK